PAARAGDAGTAGGGVGAGAGPQPGRGPGRDGRSAQPPGAGEPVLRGPAAHRPADAVLPGGSTPMNTGSRPDLTVSPISSLVTEDAAEDPRRIRISRMALVLVGVLRLATQPLMGRILPGAVDPPPERLALCGLCVLFLALTAAARYRRHVVLLARVAIYLAAAQ